MREHRISTIAVGLSIDFEAVNSRGVTLYTSPDKELAKAWVRRNAETHPGLYVAEVVRTETHRRIYMPRVALITINGRAA